MWASLRDSSCLVLCSIFKTDSPGNTVPQPFHSEPFSLELSSVLLLRTLLSPSLFFSQRNSMATHTLFFSPAILSKKYIILPRQLSLSSSASQIAVSCGTQPPRRRNHGLRWRCLADKSQVELPHDGPHAPASLGDADNPELNLPVEESNGTKLCSS